MLDILSEDGKSVLYELLYADDLVLMAETIEELEAQFLCWKTTFEKKRLKVNFCKTKVMESGGSRVVFAKNDACDVCDKRAKVHCVRCKTSKKWVHAQCARVKRVSCSMNGNSECRVCMNVSNEKSNKVLNGCLSELEKVNNYCYTKNRAEVESTQ